MSREEESSNTNRRNSIREIQEMEQIERGLEAFLQQELQGMRASERRSSGNPQLFDMDEPEEQEDFYEEDPESIEEDPEREIDVISPSGSRNSRRNELRSDYIEDWDSPRQANTKSGRTQKGSRRSVGTDRKGVGKTQKDGQRNAGSGRGEAGRAQQNSRKTSSNARKGKGAGQVSNSLAKTEGDRRKRRDRQEGAEEHYDRQNNRSRKGKKKKRFQGLKRLLIGFVAVCLVFALGMYWLAGSIYGKMRYVEIASVTDASFKENGVVNILLIGNDSRENGEDGRSDAMILLSISSKTKKIYMTSLLRDMYVEIPGHDGNRLNAAYSYGGAELLMETIEQNLDIDVNRYVLVNFEAFANLVDAVGGVDLELTSEEIEYVNGYLVEYNMLTNRPQGTDNMDTTVSGLVHLNGPQALAYSRNRYLGTDFGRTERQRKVLAAVIKKIPAAAVTNPGELLDGLMPNLTTNLTQGEFYRLSLMAGKLLGYDIEQSNIPLSGTYKNATIRGMSVLEVDFEANRKYLQENIYGQTQ